MEPLVIGISGQLHSGKDTLGEALIPVAEASGFNLLRVAFGDPVKEEVAAFLTRYSFGEITDFLNEHCADDDKFDGIMAQTFDAPPRGLKQRLCAAFGQQYYYDYRAYDPALLVVQMHDRSTKERYRELMQWWAHEYRREQFDQLYWIRIINERLEKILAGNPQKRRLLVYFSDIRYPSEAQYVQEKLGGYLIRITRPGHEASTGHPGEHALDGYKDFNLTVVNNRALADLQYIGRVAFLSACSWKWGNAGETA